MDHVYPYFYTLEQTVIDRNMRILGIQEPGENVAV